MSLFDWIVSKRSLKSKKMFMGAVILNNLNFIWDDLTEEMAKKHYLDAMKEAKRLVEKYYEPQYRAYVLVEEENFITVDAQMRDKEVMKKFFCTNVDLYWTARLMESGIPCLVALCAPIFQDEGYFHWIRLLLPSQLIVKGIMLVNDVFSFDKESMEKGNPSCLHFTDVHNREKLIAFLEGQLRAVEGDIQAISFFPVETQNILLDMVYGHYLWARDCPRYKDKGINRVNKRIEVSSARKTCCSFGM